MGYEREQFVEKVDEILICWICHGVLQDPYVCNDGRSLCKDCNTEWLTTEQTCPVDDIDVSLKAHALVPNQIVHYMVQNLEVWCHPPEKDEGGAAGGERADGKCEWKGKLQLLAEHRKSCLFQQVQCPNENCNKTMQRRVLEDHDKKCKYKKIECGKCGKELVRHQLQGHKADKCPKTLIPCPNQCTKQQGKIKQIKRIDLNHHLTNICARTFMGCPFKDQGCSVQVERQHVEQHVQDNKVQHLELVAKQVSELLEQISTLERRLETVNEKNDGLKKENDGLKTKNYGLKKENDGLKKENDGLKEENDARTTREETLEESKNSNRKLQRRLFALDLQCTELTKERQNLTKEIQQLKAHSPFGKSFQKLKEKMTRKNGKRS